MGYEPPTPTATASSTSPVHERRPRPVGHRRVVPGRRSGATSCREWVEIVGGDVGRFPSVDAFPRRRSSARDLSTTTSSIPPCAEGQASTDDEPCETTTTLVDVDVDHRHDRHDASTPTTTVPTTAPPDHRAADATDGAAADRRRRRSPPEPDDRRPRRRPARARARRRPPAGGGSAMRQAKHHRSTSAWTSMRSSVSHAAGVT